MAGLPLFLVALFATGTSLLLVHFLYQNERSMKKRQVDLKLPTVGVSTGIFGWARGIACSFSSLHPNTYEGYVKYTKNNLPFLLPNIMTGSAVVVLPPSLLHLVNRPDKDFLAFEALSANFQFQYMIDDPDIWHNVLQFEVVRRKFAREEIIAPLAAETDEELRLAFESAWGNGVEWTCVNGWDTCGRIIARTALRIMVGAPLCRDDRLLESSRLFANALMMAAGLINCLPPFVRPVAGPVLALQARFYQAKCQRILVPLVEERIKIWSVLKEETGAPNDFLQWLIAKCAATGPDQLDAHKISLRLLHLATPFIFAMGATFAQCVFDIYSDPAREETIRDLRSECERVSSKHDGLSTQASTEELFRVGSALRESMRLSDVSVTALPRDVMSAAGLDIGNGITLPKGTRCVFPTQPIHHDAACYASPKRYDAFRFSRPLEGRDGKTPAEGRLLATSVGNSFFSFGYGKHACPGRFFVSQTLKQALAYMVLSYEVEMVKAAPRWALGNAMVPPTDAQIRVRRR